MRKKYETRIEGLGNLQGGTYTTISVEGSGKFKGDTIFQECSVKGIGKALGSLQGDLLEVGGTFKVEGDIKVKELRVQGLLRTGKTNIYADKIHVEGMLRNDKEVSADYINIEGLIKTPSLLGDEIRLNYSEVMTSIGFGVSLVGFRDKMQGVDVIECTKLDASYLRCKRICAQEIHLRDHCRIEQIECDGDLYMDSTCTCESIRGDYCLHR